MGASVVSVRPAATAAFYSGGRWSKIARHSGNLQTELEVYDNWLTYQNKQNAMNSKTVLKPLCCWFVNRADTRNKLYSTKMDMDIVEVLRLS